MLEYERRKSEYKQREEEYNFRKIENGNAENAKGIYMTGLIATSKSAVEKRKEFVNFIGETELNAIIIDVKEVEGPYPLGLLSRFS